MRNTMSDPTWNYLGRFYGIDPRHLAAYNGQEAADLAEPVPATTKVKIPNADELTRFNERYEQHLVAIASSPSTLVLTPPTLAPLRGKDALEPPANARGNQVIVNAARMRRFSHTGDNYQYQTPLRSLNPTLEGNRGSAPDSVLLEPTREWWKCNVLVGDAMYAAGFDWPKSENNRYIQPSQLLAYLKAGKYGDAIWSIQVKSLSDYQPPTFEELKKARPGDVVLMHLHQTGEPGHATIMTGGPRLRDGHVEIRVVDIYGEQWYDVATHHVGVVFHPTKLAASMPAVTVGGDARNPGKILDGTEHLELPAPDAEVIGLQQAALALDEEISFAAMKGLSDHWADAAKLRAMGDTLDQLSDDVKVWRPVLAQNLAPLVDTLVGRDIEEIASLSDGLGEAPGATQCDEFFQQMMLLKSRAQVLARLDPERGQQALSSLGAEVLKACSGTPEAPRSAPLLSPAQLELLGADNQSDAFATLTSMYQ
jgi:hypothetical protein